MRGCLAVPGTVLKKVITHLNMGPAELVRGKKAVYFISSVIDQDYASTSYH